MALSFIGGNMSALTALKLVALKKPVHQPAIVIRRNKLSSRLWEQIQLAKGQMSGTPFVLMKFRSIKDKETGIRKQVEVPKRLSRGGFRLKKAKSAFPFDMELAQLNWPKASPVFK
jgi:hypothetical protein